MLETKTEKNFSPKIKGCAAGLSPKSLTESSGGSKWTPSKFATK